MANSINYAHADRTSQWAGDRYPGSPIKPNTVVLHTTETLGWPSYSNAYWPNLTYNYGASTRWRQHLPLNRSGRALENDPGGVETNTLNCVQIEMVGTCDPAYHKRYGGLFWPDAPDEALQDIARFLQFMVGEWGLKLAAPSKWPAYPSSYGNGQGQRMSGAQWVDFYGVCGHMHVPENAHGDPGNIDIHKVLALASGESEDDMPSADEVADAVIKKLLAPTTQVPLSAGEIEAGHYADALGGDQSLSDRSLVVHAAIGGRQVGNEVLPKLAAIEATLAEIKAAVTAEKA